MVSYRKQKALEELFTISEQVDDRRIIRRQAASINKMLDVMTVMKDMVIEQTEVLRGITNMNIKIADVEDSSKAMLDIMTSMRDSVLEQTSISKQMADLEVENQERKRNEDMLKPEEPLPVPVPAAPPTDEKPTGEGFSLGALLRGVDLKRLALQIVGRGVMLGALAPVIGEFVNRAVGAALTSAGVNPSFVDGIRSEVTSAATWGSLGLIFGRKIALALGTGAALWTALDQSLDLSSNISEIANKIGLDIHPSIVNGVGIVMSGILMRSIPKILSNAWAGRVGLRAGASVAASMGAQFVASSTRQIATPIISAGKMAIRVGMRGIGPAAAVAVGSLYMSYGDDAKNWLIQNAGMAPEWSSLVVDSAGAVGMGVSLGSMFGPMGMVVGAIGGLAVALGTSIYNQYTAWRKSADEKIMKDLADSELAKVMNEDFDSKTMTPTTTIKEVSENDRELHPENRTTPQHVINSTVQTQPHDTNAQIMAMSDITNMPMSDLMHRSDLLKQQINALTEMDMTDQNNVDTLIRVGNALLVLRDEYIRRTMDWRSQSPKTRNNLDIDSSEMPPQFKTVLAKGFNDVFGMIDQLGQMDAFGDEKPRFQVPSYTKWLEQSKTNTSVSPSVTVPALQSVEPTLTTNVVKPEVTVSFSNQRRAEAMVTANDSMMTNNNTPVAVYAPTINAPVSNYRGGTNVSSSRVSMTGSGSELDSGLPRSAH